MESTPEQAAAEAPVVDLDGDDDDDQTSLGPGVQVWVPHATEGFQTGVVVEEQQGGATKGGPGQSFLVRADEDDKEEVLPADSIWLRNPAILEGVDDLTKLSYMHEAAILHNLHVRYMISQIYTYTGPILIAVNPYQRLPLYSKQMISQYCGQPLGKLSPHVYAIAEDAFRSMLTERHSQSILVSGESGAGKTETTKFLLQYFAAMGEENKGEGNVHNQVLQSTPLLEAFGNAKTLRNDNSSRFGKFIEIQFDRSGNIAGASIHTYLLEKSRIVRQQLGERGYHVFYQLLAGLTDDERKELRLGSASEFHYVNQSDCTEIEGVSDSDTFQKTRKAMTVVGISDEKQLEIFKLLAAVLHLGNWKKSGSDEPIQIAATLLQCDFELMKKSLLQRKMVAGREVYFVDMDEEQAEGARDSLAMLLYSRMFDWLVVALNENIEKNKKASTLKEGEQEVFIGVLDIYGFESFEVNSFEQFCINYANEKLQQQFNQHIFKHEQQEYLKEKLDWSYINFNDNQECLDLIEQKPLGILSLLDEECRFPKASASTFALKLKQNHSKNKYFSSDRFAESSFTVSHYAGRVTYDTATFLDKNKDYIIEDQVKVMLESKSEFVRDVFKAPKAQPAPAGPASGRPGGRDGGGSSSFKFVSVAAQFRDSLSSLMNTIGKTTPHYVRCIKPNPQKKPALFDKPQVLHQLRCGGVLESVRISMAGYPGRHSYDQFYKRYRVLAPSAGKDAASPQDACKDLVGALSLAKRHYQFGITKLFLKGGQIAVLERKRGEKLSEAALKIQKTWRGYKDFRRYRNILRAVVRLQTFARSVAAKGKLRGLRENAAATKIQTTARRFIARSRYLKQRKALIYVQRVFTAKREKRHDTHDTHTTHTTHKRLTPNNRALRAERREKAAVTLQTQIRGLLKRKEFQKYRHTVIVAQNLWRQKVAKRELAELKKEARQLSTVVAAKAALENKVQELEWRLSAENKIKKKVEKENAQLRDELDELRRALREVKLADERRGKEEDERRARKEKAGREQARNHEKELDELRTWLAEEAERSAGLARELAELREAQERDRATATASQAEGEEAQRLREENERMKELMREMEEKMEADEEDYEAKILELHRELEKLRIRSPLTKTDGRKMETLQKRISDFSSIKTISGENVPTRGSPLGGSGGGGSPHPRGGRSPMSLSQSSLPSVADELNTTPTASGRPLSRISSDIERDRRRRRSLTSAAAVPTSRQLSFDEQAAAAAAATSADRRSPQRSALKVAEAADVSSTRAATADKKRDEREAFMKRIEREIDAEKEKAREFEERRKHKAAAEAEHKRQSAAADVDAVERQQLQPGHRRPEKLRNVSTDKVKAKVATKAERAPQVLQVETAQPQPQPQPLQPAAMMGTRQHSRGEESEKAKKRREIERDLLEKLQKKYRDQEFSLVGLENEAIMTLLPDPRTGWAVNRDSTSQEMVRFLLSELEPGFVSGVPAPALIIYSLFTHWHILGRPEAKVHKSKEDIVRGRNEILALIIQELYHTVQKNSGEIELIIYWLSNVCTLFHLVSEKLAELKTAAKAQKRRKGAELDDDDDDQKSENESESEDEDENEEELYTVTSFDDFDESHEFAVSPDRIRRATTSPVAFKRQLSELVTKLYALLLKRAYADLTDTLHESVLGKSLASPRNLAGSPQRAMNTIQPVKEVLSKYLLGLVQNFVFLSLVQKFFAQVFYFINATLFNEILLVRQLCTVDKAVDIKMHLANLESWIIEEGGLWLENAKVQLEPLHEIITLLMMPKKLIVSSEELRDEVIPRLNSLQIKQVLAMYTPTDMEERLSMSDIQKMDAGKGKGAKEAGDESLLLETAQVFSLSSKELHYLELNDANNIPFPFEIKQKVHELIEEDILKRMSMAKEVIKQAKGAGVLRSLVEAGDDDDDNEEGEGEGEGEADEAGGGGGSTDNISPRGADDPQKKITHFWSSFFGKDHH